MAQQYEGPIIEHSCLTPISIPKDANDKLLAGVMMFLNPYLTLSYCVIVELLTGLEVVDDRHNLMLT